MKQVTFKKNHPSGLKSGWTGSLGDQHADRLHKEGYVTIDGTDDNVPEPEFMDHALTKKDIKDGVYPGIAADAKVGDVIQIPNPKYVPNE